MIYLGSFPNILFGIVAEAGKKFHPVERHFSQGFVRVFHIQPDLACLCIYRVPHPIDGAAVSSVSVPYYADLAIIALSFGKILTNNPVCSRSNDTGKENVQKKQCCHHSVKSIGVDI